VAGPTAFKCRTLKVNTDKQVAPLTKRRVAADPGRHARVYINSRLPANRKQ
jgi:hypothetical protein